MNPTRQLPPGSEIVRMCDLDDHDKVFFHAGKAVRWGSTQIGQEGDAEGSTVLVIREIPPLDRERLLADKLIELRNCYADGITIDIARWMSVTALLNDLGLNN